MCTKRALKIRTKLCVKPKESQVKDIKLDDEMKELKNKLETLNQPNDRIEINETKEKIEKLKNKIKEKAQNRITFMHYESTDNERPKEEERDNLLIKRAYANWKKLRAPAYYRQTSLFTMTNNYIEEKIIHKINNTANDGTPYFLTANHCLGSPNSWVYYFVSIKSVQKQSLSCIYKW